MMKIKKAYHAEDGSVHDAPEKAIAQDLNRYLQQVSGSRGLMLQYADALTIAKHWQGVCEILSQMQNSEEEE